MNGLQRPRNRPLNFGDESDYNPDPGSGLQSGSRGEGLQSLIGCLIFYIYYKEYFNKSMFNTLG